MKTRSLVAAVAVATLVAATGAKAQEAASSTLSAAVTGVTAPEGYDPNFPQPTEAELAEARGGIVPILVVVSGVTWSLRACASNTACKLLAAELARQGYKTYLAPKLEQAYAWAQQQIAAAQKKLKK